MEQSKPFVITLIGAESSGKTTLARQLAELYGCPWVPEYAREYLEGLGRPYEERDLVVMAERQLEAIEMAIGNWQLATGRVQSVDFSQEAIANIGHVEWPEGVDLRSMIIIDGGMLTLRMWARIKYGTVIPVVEEALERDVTSVYLLCRPTIPWEPDPLREAPLLLDRVWIYNQYLKELGEMVKPFHVVTVNAEHKTGDIPI